MPMFTPAVGVAEFYAPGDVDERGAFAYDKSVGVVWNDAWFLNSYS